jgi:type I restriction enzyme, S subunit
MVVNRDVPTIRSVPLSQRHGRVLERGNLLLEKSGGGEKQTVGAVVTYQHELSAVCSNFVARLEVANNNHSRFLTYLHGSLYFQRVNTRSIKQTTGIQNLDGGMYLDEVVAVPPLPTQKAIADFLDRKTAAIDALIEKKQTLLTLLAEKRVALINQAVTKGLDPNVPMKDSGIPWIGEIPAHWEVMQLRRQLTLQRGVDITKDEQRDGNVPVVSSGGVASFHDTALVDGPGVVVGRKGSAGRVHWVAEDYWPHDTTLYVKCFGGNSRRYIYYKLVAMKLETFDTGSANPTVNRNIVHPVHVSWPPEEEQQKIVDMLDSLLGTMEEVATRSRHSIDRLQEYRQALITAAVTGQLDIGEAA